MNLSVPKVAFFLLAGIAFAAAMMRGRPRLNKATKVYAIVLLMLTLVQLISCFYSSDVVFSLKRELGYLTIYGTPLALSLILLNFGSKFSAERSWYSIEKWAIITLLAVGIVCIIQSVIPFALRRPEIRVLGPFSFQRGNAFFEDPNFCSSFIGVATILGLSLITRSTADKALRAIFAIAFVAFSISINVLTGSRGGLIAMVIGMILLWNGRRKLNKGKSLSPLSWSGLIILISPIFLISSAFLFIDEISSLVEVYDDETLSGWSRILTWYSGVRLLLGSPWLGVGPGNYVTGHKGSLLPEYVPTWRADMIDSLAPHANSLEITVESGIIAGILYLLFWLSIMRYATPPKFPGRIKDYRVTHLRNHYLVARISIISFMASTVFLSYHAYWMMIIIGVVLALPDGNSKDLLDQSSIKR